MEWISVNYYLPPDFVPCIILCEGSKIAEDAMAIVTEEGWFWWVDGIADAVEVKVTHWMYRPKAPTED